MVLICDLLHLTGSLAYIKFPLTLHFNDYLLSVSRTNTWTVKQ